MTIAGQAGAGKSVLATALAARWSRVLIYDPKVDPESVPPNTAVCYGRKAAAAALPGRVVYRPLPSEQRDIAAVFDDLARIVFRSGAHGIVLHELGDLGSTDAALGPFLSACFRQGRSRRVPVIALTQRPAWVPRLAFSEANHLVAFHLVSPDDRRRMAELMGPEVASQPVPRDFRFWYRGPDLSLRLCAPLSLRPRAPGG